jgi:hypothetical protein
MKDKIYIVVKYDKQIGQAVFEKLFFDKPSADLYADRQINSDLYEVWIYDRI